MSGLKNATVKFDKQPYSYVTVAHWRVLVGANLLLTPFMVVSYCLEKLS